MREIPVFGLAMVLFPGEQRALHIFEPRYREMTEHCLRTEEPFAIALAGEAGGLRPVACTARIEEVVDRFPDGRMNILVRGGQVVRLGPLQQDLAYPTADAEELVDDDAEAPAAQQAEAVQVFTALAGAVGAGEPALDSGELLSYRIAAALQLGNSTRQELLEDRAEASRLSRVTTLVRMTLRGVRLGTEVQRRAQRNGRVQSADDLADELGL
jgi:Lon protease-like protein